MNLQFQGLSKLLWALIFFVSGVSVFAQQQNQPVHQTTTLSDYMSDPETHDIYFSFVQFSDTHIDVNNEQSISDLRSAIDEVNKMPHVAFVLVSGDLTDRGDYESLSMAKRLLNKLDVPYYAVPGNNDTENTLQAATDVNFKRVFQEDRFRIQFNGFVFLGLNTAPVKQYAEGHIAAQDIVWIERQLKNIGKKTPVFIVTHHPLKTGDVDNWYVLTDIVRKYNVQMFISGHYHRNMLNNYDGIPGIVTRSTLSGSGKAGGYTLYDMTEDSLFVSEKRIGEYAERWLAFPVDHKLYIEGDLKEFPRPDYSVNDKYRNVKKSWSKQLGYTVYSAPVVSDGFVYVGDDKGVMHCMSLAKGKEIWTYVAADKIITSAVMEDGELLFEAADGFVYCLEAATGKARWKKRNTELKKDYSVEVDARKALVYNDMVVTTTKNGDVICSDAATDAVLWQYKVGNSAIGGVTAVSAKEWLVTTTDGWLLKLTVK